MIYAFCIAAHVCDESTAHWWIPLQAINSAEFCCLINVLMSCWTNCGDSSKKTVKLILCCTVMEIVIPKLMTSLARKGSLKWSFGGPMWRDSIAGGTPHKRSAWYFLSCLPERTANQTVELPVDWNPMMRMRCHCYVSFVNPTFRMVEHRDHYVAVILKV